MGDIHGRSPEPPHRRLQVGQQQEAEQRPERGREDRHQQRQPVDAVRELRPLRPRAEHDRRAVGRRDLLRSVQGHCAGQRAARLVRRQLSAVHGHSRLAQGDERRNE